MKLPQTTVLVVVMAATLLSLPFFLLFHQPTINQILCDISSQISANNSNTRTTSWSVPPPKQEITPEKADFNVSEAMAPEKVNFNVSEAMAPEKADFNVVEASAPGGEANSNVTEASGSDDAGLEAMLASAATSNKTVIITTLNQAWAAEGAILDVFLESFHKGENTEFLLNHLVIVALDQKSFERCQQLHRHCFRLETEGVDFSSRKPYMSKDFLKMMWRRMALLRTILELGYNFVFTDADILWVRNPFDYFGNDADFTISSDEFKGNKWSSGSWPNCGFQYALSNNHTIAMYRHWCKGGEDHPKVDEQTLFRRMLRNKEMAAFQVKIQFLDTVKFSGFCERSKDMTQLVTMHANCCVGMDNKIQDLRQALKDWESGRNDTNAVWHVSSACKDSMTPPSRRTRAPSPPPITRVN